ncbi:carbamoyltransferase HypF [Bradyrhizobium iriomotense]|uniref:Carbamoyltransferase HypF n=1 Tax=Bradyrhizobium iriomotense TaxID=441950 RepID=A0ABQ6ANC4_9BRAD|nr:carbamoyltransferase HypF [Bradyrhizobium iriomotense]GLR83752.1 carbamoyltransferase HypF [Bradyrhizobium iriomotense]
MSSLERIVQDELAEAVEIRVRGRVQGVGFRPTVWRYARQLGLGGEVLNDGDGVLVRARGEHAVVKMLIDRIVSDPPPLSRIDAIQMQPYAGALPDEFVIANSEQGTAHTEVSPDAAVCADCARESTDPFARRFRYPFTNCTNCGPRLSIVDGIPYDRAKTTMAPFTMCAECAREYRDPSDRRFHAEPVACHVCGPRAKLIRLDGRPFTFEQFSMLDDVDAACSLIQKGEIVAIKGLGGYQIACDATRSDTVAQLRKLKRRDGKPFALMARDTAIIRRYCSLDEQEAAELTSAVAPIVLLRADGSERLPDEVAPGLQTLGFMLPTTPLHLLLLRRMDRPMVMTSGNLSNEPQVTDDEELRERLGGIASFALTHDRRIANRVDDSVVRIVRGRPRLLRRARGYAPATLPLPQGFEAAPDLLALGGELKATFCLIKDGAAVPSQHQGDLEDVSTSDDYVKNLSLYASLFQHVPTALVVDMHPEYLSSKLGRAAAVDSAVPLIEIQHHHAHVASCLAENRYPLGAPPVLGIVLDGLGWGDDGALWGGEFLLADYCGYERLGTFKPVAMLGGAQAAREPWRNLYAHLMAEMNWSEFTMNFRELEVYAYLEAKPRNMLDAMVRNGINAPLASSCGRLFDAVAAAIGVCRDIQSYEGEAAARLEALVDEDLLLNEDEALAYPLTIPNLRGSGPPYIEPLAMWHAVLGDLILKTPASVIATRFHKGLSKAIVAMTRKLAGGSDGTERKFATAALTGGCFQNRILFEEVARRLERDHFGVLSQAQVPANDAGLALGQAAIAAAHLIESNKNTREGNKPCVSAFPGGS